MFLIIGNPTNIYLATSGNISFFEYTSKMALPTIFAGIVSLGLLLLIFRKSLKAPLKIEIEEAQTNELKILALKCDVVTPSWENIINYLNIIYPQDCA